MKRSVLITGILAVIAGIYFIVLLPLAEKRASIRERSEAGYASLEKYERFLSGAVNAESELKAVKGRLERLESRLLGETDTSLAVSRLQSRVQDIARGSGLTITSIRPLPAESLEGYASIPLYIDATGGIRELSEFLKGLDSSSVFIGVEKLDVATAPQETLRIKIQLSGLKKA